MASGNILNKQTINHLAESYIAHLVEQGQKASIFDIDSIVESICYDNDAFECLPDVTESVLRAFNEQDNISNREPEKDANLDENIETHEELNPKLFDSDKKLLPEVAEALQKVIDKFVELLDVNGVKIDIKDVVLTGSNANYNYTADSDIDLHIIARTEGGDDLEQLYHALYDAYRSLFAKKFTITLRDIPVELYVETRNTPVTSGGQYSIISDQWIKEPTVTEIPEIDTEAVEKEYNKWEKRCEEIIHADFGKIISEDTINDLLGEIYDMRQAGLDEGGEFSIGNLVFKELRNHGYLELLKQQRDEAASRELSLEALEENDDVPYDEIPENTEISTFFVDDWN